MICEILSILQEMPLWLMYLEYIKVDVGEEEN